MVLVVGVALLGMGGAMLTVSKATTTTSTPAHTKTSGPMAMR